MRKSHFQPLESANSPEDSTVATAGKMDMHSEGWQLRASADRTAACPDIDICLSAQAKVKALIQLLNNHKIDEADILSGQDIPGVPGPLQFVRANPGNIKFAKQLMHNMEIQQGVAEADNVKQAEKEAQRYKPANTAKTKALIAGIELDTKRLTDTTVESRHGQSQTVSGFFDKQQKQLRQSLSNCKSDCQRLLDQFQNQDLSLANAQHLSFDADDLYQSLKTTEELLYLRRMVSTSDLSGIKDTNNLDTAIMPNSAMAKTTKEANVELSNTIAALDMPFFWDEYNPDRTSRGEGFLDVAMFCNPIGLGFIAAEESGIHKQNNQGKDKLYQASSRAQVEKARNKVLQYYVLNTVMPAQPPAYTDNWQEKPIADAGTQAVILDKMLNLMKENNKRNFKSLDALYQQLSELQKKQRYE